MVLLSSFTSSDGSGFVFVGASGTGGLAFFFRLGEMGFFLDAERDCCCLDGFAERLNGESAVDAFVGYLAEGSTEDCEERKRRLETNGDGDVKGSLLPWYASASFR